MNPLEHYLSVGAVEGRSPGPGFDAAWYLKQNPDIGTVNPLLHYLSHGASEGRKPHARALSLEDKRLIQASGFFDAAWYLAQYPDAAQSGMDAIEHYLSVGAVEGYSPGPGFDAAWYLNQNPDIGTVNPLLHYLQHGASEGRKPHPAALSVADKRLIESSGLFDSAWYLAQYPHACLLYTSPSPRDRS